MIPAPDAFRCEARHPHNSLVRCFRTKHDNSDPHQHEEPHPMYAATTVRQWWDTPPPSEFPEGPYENVPSKYAVSDQERIEAEDGLVRSPT